MVIKINTVEIRKEWGKKRKPGFLIWYWKHIKLFWIKDEENIKIFNLA